MKKIIFMPAIMAMLGSPVWAANSLSDLAVEQLKVETTTTGTRNIFVASELEGDIDISSLTLEGILIGNNIRLAILSGRILRAGEAVGRYKITAIQPGQIDLKSEDEERTIKMVNYVAPFKTAAPKDFSIELRNADIKDSLRMLAIAAGYNLITPEDTQGRVNLSFENTPLKNVIRAILKVNNYQFAVENGIMRVGKPDQFLGGTDLLATTFQLKYAKAKDLVDPIKLLLSDKGSVSAEERINLVSVKDYDANVDSVRLLLQAIDQKDQQVQIDAHIVDASTDFSRNLGIKWGISGTPARIQYSGGDNTGTVKVGDNTAIPAHVNLGAANPTSAMAFRIGNIPGNTNIDVQFTAAEEKGDIKIISKPSVMTINNKPAKIRSGLKIYVKANSDINVGTTGGAATASESSLQEIDTGIELNVTPQITPNNFIKLTIEAEESEADFSRTVDGIPAIIDNIASTTILLENGETAVIGGLVKRKDTLTHKRVPGFSNIPVLGNFFKSKSKTKKHNELMIFITPHVVK